MLTCLVTLGVQLRYVVCTVLLRGMVNKKFEVGKVSGHRKHGNGVVALDPLT